MTHATYSILVLEGNRKRVVRFDLAVEEAQEVQSNVSMDSQVHTFEPDPSIDFGLKQLSHSGGKRPDRPRVLRRW